MTNGPDGKQVEFLSAMIGVPIESDTQLVFAC